MPNNYLQQSAMRDLKNGYLVRAYFRDLRGKARSYQGSYLRSWQSMKKKLLKEGYTVIDVVGKRGYILNRADPLHTVVYNSSVEPTSIYNQ